MKQQPIVDQDKYKGEWVAFDPKTDAVLSHSRSLADADGRAIEQGTLRKTIRGDVAATQVNAEE